MFKEIFYRQFADIRREEWPRALLLSAFFFLVIATYWILKPIKRGVILNYFGDAPLTLFGMHFGGAETEQLGKVLNVVVAYVVVMFFTWLVRRVARHHLVLIFAGIFAAAFGFYATVIYRPTEWVVFSFYVLGDMFNTVMVAIFWAFTNDIVDAGEAKRTYGLIGMGGVLGGFLGATLVRTTVENIGRATLLTACIIPMACVAAIAYAVHRRLTPESVHQRTAASRNGRTAAWAGARLVLSSRYLLAIAGIIGIYELVSNIVDFQLSSLVVATIHEDLQRDAFFGLLGQVIGVGSIAVQFLLTSYVMKRYGLPTALSALPAAILVTSLGFLLFPTLLLAAALSVSDNTLNYSIHQSAKETLYTPTSSDVTYKAKAFIDMLVQRFAKVISALLNLAFVALFVNGLRWLSLLTLVLIVAWFILIRHVGKTFNRKERAANGRQRPQLIENR